MACSTEFRLNAGSLDSVFIGGSISLSRRIEYTLAMKVDDARRGAHRPRAEQNVEREIALEVIEQETQETLQAEVRIRAHEAMRGIRAAVLQIFRDDTPGGGTVLERGVNAARGDGRYHAR